MPAEEPLSVTAAPRVAYALPVAQRLPQLDGLRAGAVLLVVVAHTTLMGSPWWFAGDYGVRLFFVLSAFLITGILLRATPGRQAFARFYARRALRIFPAYYALLAVCWLTNVASTRADLPWHAFYASNWLLMAHWVTRLTPPWYLGHLWSLAVEEQFYLCWPLLLFTVPRPQRIFGLAVGVAVLMRSVAPNYALMSTPTWTTLDSFGVGALLAWRWHQNGPPLSRWVLIAGGILIALTARHYVPIRPFGASLVSVWLVDQAARGNLPLLQWAPLRGLGRISYGVYLWHLPVLWMLRGWRTDGVALFVVDLALTLGIASLSWGVLEQPLNRLKDRWHPA